MERICLVYGGNSLENEISVLTALKIAKNLEESGNFVLKVYQSQEGNFYFGDGLDNKNNYYNKTGFIKGEFIKKKDRFYFGKILNKTEFDIILILGHGKNIEDGTLGAYFDTLNIPCLYPGLYASSLLQNKIYFKYVLKGMGVKTPSFITMNETEYKKYQTGEYSLDITYPKIVKPAKLGSSIAVNKVNNENELISALIEAFHFDDEVLIENCIENLKEINVAVYKLNGKLILSDVERVNSSDRVLTFADKYDNYSFNSSHIIPADVDSSVINKVKDISKEVYNSLNLFSVVRFDFLYDELNDELYLNEINAIPGSLAYYLFEKQGKDITKLVKDLISSYYELQKNKRKKTSRYYQGFLNHLKEK